MNVQQDPIIDQELSMKTFGIYNLKDVYYFTIIETGVPSDYI